MFTLRMTCQVRSSHRPMADSRAPEAARRSPLTPNQTSLLLLLLCLMWYRFLTPPPPNTLNSPPPPPSQSQHRHFPLKSVVPKLLKKYFLQR